MSDTLTCVKKTFYSEYFEEVISNVVFLLDKESAKKAWEKNVGIGSESYFDLPDDSWLIEGQKIEIGRWMEAYNTDDILLVKKLLASHVGWQDETVVNFFVNNEIVFITKWKDFLQYWDSFIAIEDDCPIVIPDILNKNRKAIIFRPIGDIVKIVWDCK